ncbi:hypothetical protein GCM10025771_19630 [Niveibacterium umoris]|uniref:Cellobiose phosphorylase n=1 Tax=Niveibacterium umoris TaxID=1193620 RepID=A0A840BMV9_9RHOO|nr:hypothetical protein [Niveibacterium umoris]MBB4012849.1 hypothetical protein [Niveibacterium umoris]
MKSSFEPVYRVDPADPLRFRIDGYHRAKPFASFFPGIAGVMGVPLWAFYVNRGQAVSSFGLQDKDGAIVEFQPANKAYRLTASTGFRTFIHWTRGARSGYAEAFRDSLSSRSAEPARHLSISPWDLHLEEHDSALGLRFQVRYFTIPNEPIAALAREVLITNTAAEPVTLQLIDGLPQFMPYGLNDWAMKNMSRTIEAWYTVDNLENRAPYSRLKVTFADTAEVKPIEKGHAFFAILTQGGASRLLDPVIDPQEVFGRITDFDFPELFVDGYFEWCAEQQSGNRTPSALTHASVTLAAGESVTVQALYGKVDSLAEWNARLPQYATPAFFAAKADENEQLVRALMDRCFLVTEDARLNAYAGQNFLDNLLRGGFPLSISDGERRDVMYLFSRRHGDTERDYNQFRLSPTYFSQGNGAYRDVNQNRRNDVWFNPDVGSANIEYFINLIQLDGYNPQVVKGVRYQLDASAAMPVLARLVPHRLHESLLAALAEPWIPDTVIRWAQAHESALCGSLFDLVSALVLASRKLEDAEHGEGFWTDHWFYNLDLIESYEGLFPDRMAALLTDARRFSYFDNAVGVLPRAQKYVLTDNGPRQYEAVALDEAKAARIALREREADKARTQDGAIYRSSLLSKLVLLATVKLSTLDPAGMGIEMEADKPNWNDSINGLPGLFGSSINESQELLRLVRLIRRWAEDYALQGAIVTLPEEAASLFDQIRGLVAQRVSGAIEAFDYWSQASDAREAYRAKLLQDLSGHERGWPLAELSGWLAEADALLSAGIERAFDHRRGICTTYWMFELAEYLPLAATRELHGRQLQTCRAFRFEAIPVAPFIEGSVHALRLATDPAQAARIAAGVRASELYDVPLGMYKVSGATRRMPLEIGRLQAFTPGWLENESIFLHMAYKYLLELLRAGLYDAFWQAAWTGLVAWRDPAQYGRSIFENVSFLVTSANPDARLHGNGFSARLSGSTSEFYNILLLAMLGERPFRQGADGTLSFVARPALPGSLFTVGAQHVRRTSASGILATGQRGHEVAREATLPAGSVAFSILGDCLLVLENPQRLDTWGEAGARVLGYRLHYNDGTRHVVPGCELPAPHAQALRDGAIERLTVMLGQDPGAAAPRSEQ